MKMLILAQFCCGCSVKTGAIIVGVMNLIISIGNASMYETEVEEGMPIFSIALIIFDAVANLLSFVLSVALIYGVLKQDKLQFIKPWLFFYFIYIPVFTVISATLAVYCMTVSQVEVGLTILISMLFERAFQLYGFLTVYSHYRNVESQLQLPPTAIYFLV